MRPTCDDGKAMHFGSLRLLVDHHQLSRVLLDGIYVYMWQSTHLPNLFYFFVCLVLENFLHVREMIERSPKGALIT